MNPEAALRLERHVAEWSLAGAVVPHLEVHADADVTWTVHPESAWSNAGVEVRFTEATAATRLDQLRERYRRNGHGMGLWISPAATPVGIEALLKARGLRCRKRYPAMERDLGIARAPVRRIPGLDVRLVEDVEVFRTTPHAMIGPLTTERRRLGFAALKARLGERPARTFPFVAWLGGEAVGSSLLYMGNACAGLHDLSVPMAHRGQGIGAALLEHTCAEAARRGASRMVLLATSDGERVYLRNGFVEVARIAYWYGSLK